MAKKVLLVPIDYGSNRSCDQLSMASEQALRALIGFLIWHFDERRQIIAHCVADLPDWGMRGEDSLCWKSAILDEAIKTPLPRIVVPAKTSIDEAQGIKNALVERGWEAGKVILFCDKWHARLGGLLEIWQNIFPEVEFEAHEIHCQWGRDYACTYMRSETRWIAHNLERKFLLRSGLMKYAIAWRVRKR